MELPQLANMKTAAPIATVDRVLLRIISPAVGGVADLDGQFIVTRRPQPREALGPHLRLRCAHLRNSLPIFFHGLIEQAMKVFLIGQPVTAGLSDRAVVLNAVDPDENAPFGAPLLAWFIHHNRQENEAFWWRLFRGPPQHAMHAVIGQEIENRHHSDQQHLQNDGPSRPEAQT